MSEDITTMHIMNNNIRSMNFLILQTDFETYLKKKKSAETILPILDPTFYQRHNKEGAELYEELVTKYREIQIILNKLIPEFDKRRYAP